MRKTVVATNGVSVVTRFLNDRNNPTGYSQVLEELDAAGNVLAVNTFGHDLIAREVGADVRYYVYDGHGSVRALTDASGIETDRYDYDAFGLLIQRQALNPLTGLLEDVPVTFTGFPLHPSSFILQPFLYCGEFFDHDLGMVFLRARYMDPGRGRFWTMDAFEGFNTDPVSLHKYLYANADAVNGVDPIGTMTLSEVMVIGAIISTLSHTALAGAYIIFRASDVGGEKADRWTACMDRKLAWAAFLAAELGRAIGGSIPKVMLGYGAGSGASKWSSLARRLSVGGFLRPYSTIFANWLKGRVGVGGRVFGIAANTLYIAGSAYVFSSAVICAFGSEQ